MDTEMGVPQLLLTAAFFVLGIVNVVGVITLIIISFNPPNNKVVKLT